MITKFIWDDNCKFNAFPYRTHVRISLANDLNNKYKINHHNNIFNNNVKNKCMGYFIGRQFFL